MTRDWKNKRKYPTAKQPMFSTRLPADLLDELRAVTKANDTTLSAVTEYALRRFLAEEVRKPAPAGPDLFE